MKALYRTDKPLLANPTAWTTRVKPSAVAGKYVAWNENETVISIQPNGDVQERPKGTDGPYEQSELIGDKFVYDVGTPVIYGAVVKP